MVFSVEIHSLKHVDTGSCVSIPSLLAAQSSCWLALPSFLSVLASASRLG